MKIPVLQVTSDFVKEFNEIVSQFKNDEVLVGIPASDAAREGDSGINNAALLAINNFGSPINNIPPRPVMEIGIHYSGEAIAEEFKKVAQKALTQNGVNALEQYYDRAGSIASQSIKKTINDQFGVEPPSEATLIARERKGFKGTKALIVTGQLRNAITWVTRKKNG